MATLSHHFLPYQSTVGKTLSRIWLFFLALYYLLALFSTMSAASSAFSTVYLLAGVASLSFAGFFWGLRLRQAAAHLKEFNTPHSLWRAWLRGIVLRASLYLMTFSVSMNLLEVTHSLNSNWSAVWALSALCLSTSFLLSLVSTGKAPRIMSIALIIGLFCYGVSTELTTAQSWMQQTWYAHLPFFLTWPIIAILLRFLWISPPAQGAATLSFPAHARFQIPTRIKNALFFFRRYIALDQRQIQLQTHGRARNFSHPFLSVMSLFWFSFAMPFLAIGWEEKINLKHLISLGISTSVVSTYLVAKDLHWRFLLQPRGFARGRIATHILLSTLS